MRVDVDVEHPAADRVVELLDHAVRLRRAGLCVAVLRAQFVSKMGVKHLPLSVSTWVMRNENTVAASRRKAVTLFSVSLSLTAIAVAARNDTDAAVTRCSHRKIKVHRPSRKI